MKIIGHFFYKNFVYFKVASLLSHINREGILIVFYHSDDLR